MPRTWPNILGLVHPGSDGVEVLQSQLGMLPGWVVFYRSMARAAQVYSGDDFRQFTEAEIGVICCLEWDQGEGGTVPAPGLVKPFRQRCRNYVEASTGCHVWIIGNEMNAVSQWPLTGQRAESIVPRAPAHQVMEPRYRPDRYPLLFNTPGAEIQEGHFPISPAHYVDCYIQVRESIKTLPGHEQDLVLVGAVAPWNTDAKDPDNPSGDWIRYFTAIASALQGGQCEGFALHTATLGPDPELLLSDRTLSFPFGGYKAGFRCFEDFIAAVPPQHRRLPLFITEASQLRPWLDANDGWVFQACTLIQDYNQAHTHSPVRCLSLFQWETDSPWAIRGKSYLLTDIRDTLHMLADRALKATLCEVVWERVEIPEPIVVGQTLNIAVTFSNTTAQRLCCSGDDPVRLAVAYQADSDPATQDMVIPDLRYPLPEDVAVGAALTCQVGLPTPPVPGEYRLLIGIAKTQFVWSTPELEGAFVCSISILEPALPEAVSAVSESRDDSACMDPEHQAPAIPILAAEASLTLSAETVPPMEPDTPAAASRTVSEKNGVQDRPATETPVPEQPVDFAIVDLTAFFPAGTNDKAVRLLSSLHRIVFIETGLPATTPMDAQLDHFLKLGLEGMPMHYVLEDAGAVYQVLPLTTMPLSYSRNLAPAIVLGLEGRARTPAEAKERLRRAVQCSATLLRDLRPFGLPNIWEIGMDSVDGEIPFCGLSPEGLEAVQEAMHEQWQRLGMAHTPLEVTAIALPFEAALAEESTREPDATTTTPASERHGVPAGAAAPVPEGSAALADEPLPMAPFASAFTQVPLDLESAESAGLEYAYREKTSFALWATGDTGTAPVAQLRRVHALQYGDILYHFVISPSGQIFETRRGQKPDEFLRPPDRDALHIGLLGDFKHQFPAETQTRGCSLLLANLAYAGEQAIDPDTPGSRPVRIGTEQWWHKEDWRQRVLQEASRLRERMEEEKADRTQAEHGDGIAENALSPPDAPSPAAAALPDAAFPDPAASESRRWHPLPPTKAPRIVNKIGTLPSHPRMQIAKRQLESIRAICIHHSDAPGMVSPEQLAQSLVLDQSTGDIPLHGLPYHFFVHPDGQIDQLADLDEVCQGTAVDNEPFISIGLAGKFTGTVNPTPDQLQQTGSLISWLMREHFLNLADIKGHKEIDAQEAVCPGEEWDQGRTWKDSLFFHID